MHFIRGVTGIIIAFLQHYIFQSAKVSFMQEKMKYRLIFSEVKYGLCLRFWCPKKSQIASFQWRHLASAQLQSTEPQVMRTKARNNNASLDLAVVSNIHFTLRPCPHQAFLLTKAAASLAKAPQTNTKCWCCQC